MVHSEHITRTCICIAILIFFGITANQLECKDKTANITSSLQRPVPNNIIMPKSTNKARPPDTDNSALLIIHMQNDTVNEGGYMDFLPLNNIQKIIPNISLLAKKMRTAGKPVIHCYMSVKSDYSDALWPYWNNHNIMEKDFFVEGTWGAQIIEELSPKDGDYLNEDKSYNSFYGSKLDKTLKKLKVDTVIITGVHTNICVFNGAAGAIERGYSVIVIADATAASSVTIHKAALEGLESRGKSHFRLSRSSCCFLQTQSCISKYSEFSINGRISS